MKDCRICPRECGADRTAGERGVCGAGILPVVARAALHFWEEPCISGRRGSGAVFFSGCSLGCVFCQNAAISGTDPDQAQPGHPRSPLPGKEITVRHLADIFLRLQNEEHANNLNLVTGTHFIPQAAQALRLAKAEGLHIPVVWNTGGYEKVSSLRLLEGLVDIYLPDFKYLSADLARQYSRVADYPDRAKEALAEMVRQAGPLRYAEEDDDGQRLLKSGVIVRHLVLPGHTMEAKRVIRYIRETYGDAVGISILNQYTPMERVREDPLLGRRVTKREYERVVDYALGLGVENGFIQEGGTAEESFIPSWNGEGV